MQVDDTTQQQRKARENSAPKRQKAIMEEKHVHFGGAFEAEDPALGDKRVRAHGQRPPGAAKNFLEGYTDSPEFSRFPNPVVHKNQEGDDDEDDYIAPPKFANYQSPMDRPKADPLEYRRLASFGAHLQTKATLLFEGFNGARLPVQSAVPAGQAPMAEDDEDVMDEDDEEPEDDTFEFLLK